VSDILKEEVSSFPELPEILTKGVEPISVETVENVIETETNGVEESVASNGDSTFLTEIDDTVEGLDDIITESKNVDTLDQLEKSIAESEIEFPTEEPIGDIKEVIESITETIIEETPTVISTELIDNATDESVESNLEVKPVDEDIKEGEIETVILPVDQSEGVEAENVITEEFIEKDPEELQPIISNDVEEDQKDILIEEITAEIIPEDTKIVEKEEVHKEELVEEKELKIEEVQVKEEVLEKVEVLEEEDVVEQEEVLANKEVLEKVEETIGEIEEALPLAEDSLTEEQPVVNTEVVDQPIELLQDESTVQEESIENKPMVSTENTEVAEKIPILTIFMIAYVIFMGLILFYR